MIDVTTLAMSKRPNVIVHCKMRISNQCCCVIPSLSGSRHCSIKVSGSGRLFLSKGVLCVWLGGFTTRLFVAIYHSVDALMDILVGPLWCPMHTVSSSSWQWQPNEKSTLVAPNLDVTNPIQVQWGLRLRCFFIRILEFECNMTSCQWPSQ